MELSWQAKVVEKLKDYYQLTKFTLSFTVVFSSLIAYLLVPGLEVHFWKVLLLFVAGFFLSGTANALNQIIERHSDAKMSRTKHRPLASGRMSVTEAVIFIGIFCLAGLLIMGLVFNWLCALVSLLSFLLYGFLYTPWKKWNSFAVFIGAFPGAFPPLIGWVAGSNAIFGTLAAGGWILFAIQFLWQFPHFWAIGWVAYDDYKKAGFKLLPSTGGKDGFSALQAVAYTVMLIPVGFLPYVYGISGMLSAIVVLLMNVFLLFRAVELYRFRDMNHARKLMFGAYIYFVVVQLALLADKV